jgi:hypothetical protein
VHGQQETLAQHHAHRLQHQFALLVARDGDVQVVVVAGVLRGGLGAHRRSQHVLVHQLQAAQQRARFVGVSGVDVDPDEAAAVHRRPGAIEGDAGLALGGEVERHHRHAARAAHIGGYDRGKISGR